MSSRKREEREKEEKSGKMTQNPRQVTKNLGKWGEKNRGSDEK